MKLHDVQIRPGGDTIRVVGLLEWQGRTQELYFEYPARFGEFVSPHADGFAAALLPAAMRAGEDLAIVPPLSEPLAFQLGRIRDVFHCWHPDEMARIELDLRTRPRAAPREPLRAATFFSGGVDSFYTLLKFLRSERLPAPLTHIIFMRGVAFPLNEAAEVEDGVRTVMAVAQRLGVGVIVGTTNLRTVFPESFLRWEKHFFGSALAGTALSLAAGLDYVCIPSSFTYRHLVPHGSHPLVDEWYSTEDLRLIHDGCEVSRAQKVAKSVEWDRDLVMQYLRVCIWNADGAENCGRCRKCVRTAIALEILGVLRDMPSFVHKGRDEWENVTANDHLVLIEENLALARERQADPELVALLQRAARAHVRRERIRHLAAEARLEWLVPQVRDLYWSVRRSLR
jgi:hypothetical protein